MYFIHNTFKNNSFHFLTKPYLHSNSTFTNLVSVMIQFPFVGVYYLTQQKWHIIARTISLKYSNFENKSIYSLMCNLIVRGVSFCTHPDKKMNRLLLAAQNNNIFILLKKKKEIAFFFMQNFFFIKLTYQYFMEFLILCKNHLSFLFLFLFHHEYFHTLLQRKIFLVCAKVL